MTLIQLIREGIKGWHGVKLNQPDWSDHSHSVALSAELPKEGLLVHFIFNAYWEPLDFELPPIGTGKRNLMEAMDRHFSEVARRHSQRGKKHRAISESTYQAGPRSVVVLWANLGERTKHLVPADHRE